MGVREQEKQVGFINVIVDSHRVEGKKRGSREWNK